MRQITRAKQPSLCKRGAQTCSTCPDISCGDNTTKREHLIGAALAHAHIDHCVVCYNYYLMKLCSVGYNLLKSCDPYLSQYKKVEVLK